MVMLPMSDDVRKLNPSLAGSVVYRTKRERLLKASDLDGFDSQLERDFFAELRARGLTAIAHPFTLHLPGGVDYTPDFIAWNPDRPFVPVPTVYEVKGSIKAKNARDSRTRFRLAAGLYPCFVWVWVTRSKSGKWIEKVYRS